MTFTRLDWLDSSPSTNTQLVAAVTADPQGWPSFSALATLDQTAGRGRLARVWTAPAGRSLALSVFVSTEATAEAPTAALDPVAAGWLSLIAALSLTEAVSALPGLDARPVIKWPNDVQTVGENGSTRKICGILAEAVPGHGVVVGLGVNLWLDESELPVPTAGSLQLAGWRVQEDSRQQAVSALVEDVAGRWREHHARFLASGGDAVASGIARAVSDATVTVGQRVRIELPSGEFLEGDAIGLSASGSLLVDADGARHEITVGDITHLRPA